MTYSVFSCRPKRLRPKSESTLSIYSRTKAQGNATAPSGGRESGQGSKKIRIKTWRANIFTPREGHGSRQKRSIKKISRGQSSRLRTYRKIRGLWLQMHATCENPLCMTLNHATRPQFAEQVHHLRGRIAKLLLAKEYWKAVCPQCHDWIHRNPKHARAVGMLCKPGEWGKYL